MLQSRGYPRLVPRIFHASPALGLLLILAGSFFLAPFGSARASSELVAPKGAVILTVSGKITKTNKEKTALFDMEMIQALGRISTRTHTPWAKGEVVYEGVRVRDLLAAVGVEGTSIHAIGLDGYKVTIPIEDFESYDVIVAYRMNGRMLRIRDNGPLWIVYPWDDHPELKTEHFYSRSVWQLNRIVVE